MPDEHEPANSAASARAASVYAEHLAARVADSPADIDELCLGRPELEPELRRLHLAHEAVEAALEDLGLSSSLTRRLDARLGPDADPSSAVDEEDAADPKFVADVVQRLSHRSGAYGRYRLKEEFARGGMGAILRVWDEDLRRNLAMKVMIAGTEGTPTPDARSLGRFLEEAQVTGQLDHPGIVPVHELGLDPEGRVYFTMKLVRGRTLREVLDLASKGQEDWNQTRALGVLLKVCEAVSYAHAKGVIHRDLKPANIMVGRFGEVFVMDWGLAKVVGRRDEKDLRTRSEPDSSQVSSERVNVDPETPLNTMDGDVVGTPAYMSPEQARGRVGELGPHSDVYSIGAILYHLLAGRMPYSRPGTTAENHAIWRALQAEPPEPLADVAPRAVPELVSICEKAMEREVCARFGSVEELAGELRAYLEGRVVQAHRTGAVIELRKWVARNRLAAGALAASLLFLVVGAASVYWMQRSKIEAIEAEQRQTLAADLRADEQAAVAAAAARAALEQRQENLVLQADYAIENANLQRAEVLMAEYRGLDPDASLPHLVLARGYSQYLRTAEAEAEYLAALKKGFEIDATGPDDARGLYLRGLALVIEREPGRLGEAADCLRGAIRLDPQLRGAYFPLYSLLKEAGDLAGASESLASFQELLATGDPYYGVVTAIRAELEGRFDDAIGELTKVEARIGEVRATELRVNRILGRLHLARALAGPEPTAVEDDLDAAERRLQAAVAAVPSDAGSWANLGVVELRRDRMAFHENGDLEGLPRALEFGRRAVLEYPKYPGGHGVVLSALVLIAARDFDSLATGPGLFLEARQVAATLRSLDPAHASLDLMESEIDYHLGMLVDVQGDGDEAESLYRRSVSLNPNQVNPRFLLAQRQFMREEYEPCLQQLEAAREVLTRCAADPAIRDLPQNRVVQIHVWTLGAAGYVRTPEAIEIGRAARVDVEEALEAGGELDPVELLNYAEFLATSPAPELRDCLEAARVFERFGLAERLADSPYEASVHAVEAAFRDCE